MDSLLIYLEKKYLETIYEKSKLELCKSTNQLIIKNSFYYFKLKKVNDRYILSRFWKKGILLLFYTKQKSEMDNIYEDIKEYSKNNNIIIEELFYNNSNLHHTNVQILSCINK